MIDAEIILARDRHVMMRDGVEQARVAILVRRAVGDDGGVDAVLLQIEREMQAADAGADNSDRPFQLILPDFRLLLVGGEAYGRAFELAYTE